MSRRCMGSAILFALLLVGAESVKNDWEEFLLGERLAEKLKLLVPERLIRNRELVNDERAGERWSSSCARDLVDYERAIGKEEAWALKMLDASSSVPSGLLHGNVIDMGTYDECVDARGSSPSGREIHGHHCMYSINPTLKGYSFPLKPTLSICVPASCADGDVAGLVNSTINTTQRLKELGTSLASVSCTTREVDNKVNYMVFAVFIYVGLLVLCTFCDVVISQYGSVESEIVVQLSRFSLLKNAKAIFSTEIREDDVPVIHGIRVLSTMWIVLLHQYFLQLFAVNVNTIDLPKWFSSRGSIVVLSGTFAVDIFFTLSGFLVAYSFIRQMQKKHQFNLILYYLHRFIRLTPPVVFLMIYVSVLHPSGGARSEWLNNIFFTGCKTKWWSYLLYLQNFVESNNYCFLHLWSLAVDMQLFWISPFLLYSLYKIPKLGFAILVTLFLISMTISAFIVGINKYSAIYINHKPSISTILKAYGDVYLMPYTRASPWFLGMLFGYEVTQKNIKPNKMMLNVGWIFCLAATAFCILGLRVLTSVSYEYNLTWEIFFASFARPLISFIICWIIYASIYNSSGIISVFLSWKYFLPLSKISYSIYMTHLVIPFAKIGGSKTSVYFNNIIIVHDFIVTINVALITGFFFSVICEMPWIIFEGIILNRRSKFLKENKKCSD